MSKCESCEPGGALRRLENATGKASLRPACTLLLLAGLSAPGFAQDAYFVTDSTARRLIEVGATSGNRVVASGPQLTFPEDLVAFADGSVYVADRGARAIYRINRENGIPALVSGLERGSGPAFSAPVGIVRETANRLLVLDAGERAVFRVTIDTGARTLLTTSGAFTNPMGIAIGTQHAFVSDSTTDSIYRVALSNGAVTLLSSGVSGSPPFLSTPSGMTIDPDGALLLADSGSKALFRIDTNTGARTVLSNNETTTDTQRLFSAPVDVAVIGASAYVMDSGRDSVFQVNRSTGERTLITGPDLGSGTTLGVPVGITALPDGELMIVDRSLGVPVIVSLSGGARTTVPGSMVGNGPSFVAPQGIVRRSTTKVGIVDSSLRAVIEVDLQTGDRTIVSSSTVGGGPTFTAPRGISFDETARYAVGDTGSDKVYTVVPGTGDRDILSEASDGLLPRLTNPVDFAPDAFGKYVMADPGIPAVLLVDRASGIRSTLSGSGVGTGTNLFAPTGIAVESNGNVLVTDGQFGASSPAAPLPALLRVNRSTGQRTVVSSSVAVPPVGEGPALGQMSGVILAPGGAQAIVVDRQLPGLTKIELATGNRSYFSRFGTGGGVPFLQPEFLVFAPAVQTIPVTGWYFYQ